ncbi:hypothetical protein FQN57_002567 [Myotisia sp. PD_48]|nr:hypothetical protein FQN57_002567 [Myotisia sp. PD_48]
MFGQRSQAPAAGGLMLNTSTANSFSGNSLAPASGTPTGSSVFGSFGNGAPKSAPTQPSSGSLFPSLNLATSQPQSATSAFGGFGGNTPATSQPQSASPFGSLGGNIASTQPAAGTGGNSLFGRTSIASSQPQQQQSGGSVFGALGGGQQNTTATTSASSMFSLGGTANQAAPKPSAFGSFGQTAGASNTGSLFNTNPQQQPQQQQQQQQGPTLSLFKTPAEPTKPGQTAGTTVQGVKIDVSNLVPTTKFESCSDELKREIEAIDTFILNQIRMCNEVSDLLPTISNQGATIPNDVEFVQGKLDTLQEALENDAAGIEHVRNLTKQDATDAKLAFRTLDTLFLPLQYQPGPGERWWSPNQQTQSLSKHSLRSAMGLRNSTLALPEEIESDLSATSEGKPTNLVDYFSERTDDMNSVLDKYRNNLKQIEDHLYNVEFSLQKKLHGLISSRGRDGGKVTQTQSQIRELASTLGDVESAIIGVASRVGSVKEEAQELALGSLGINGLGASNRWQPRPY